MVIHIWLTTYLTNRTQRVIVDGRSSGEDPVLSGVPKGTVLGPLMFLTYINDITLNLTSQMKLFADDALLFRPIKSEKDCKSLQKDLNALETWSKRWKMTFNTSKCHVLRMTGEKTIITQNYKLQYRITPTLAWSLTASYHGKFKYRKLRLEVPKPSIW